MTTKQPLALALADELMQSHAGHSDEGPSSFSDAAHELRRLHAENEALRAELKTAHLNYAGCMEDLAETEKALGETNHLKQEPVAWMDVDDQGNHCGLTFYNSGTGRDVPLYTAPQPAAWVGLTDSDKAEIEQKAGISEEDDGYIVSQLFKLTDDKLREKNSAYDQQALELCDECGWKTLIPGEGCLNCGHDRDTALLRQALEALKSWDRLAPDLALPEHDAVIAALKERLQ